MITDKEKEELIRLHKLQEKILYQLLVELALTQKEEILCLIIRM